MEKKPWYSSKIVLLAIALIAVFGGNLLTGFVSGQITQEQLDAIRASYPQAVDIIKRLLAGESILSVAGSVIGLLILVARAWFTRVPGISLLKKA
jgi:hypothetical protein